MNAATYWRRCGCIQLEALGRKPQAALSSFQVQLLQGLPDKARTYPGSRVIQVDRERWRSWSALQRQAVLEHEAAHEEDPTACEPCTDARAGARMRWAGVSLVAAIDALGSAVEHRQVRESVRIGWLAADAAMRSRGGKGVQRVKSGEPPSDVTRLPTARPYLSADGVEDWEQEISIGTPDVDGTSYGLPDLYPGVARPAPSGSRSRSSPTPSPSPSPSSGRLGAGVVVGLLLLAAAAALALSRK